MFDVHGFDATDGRPAAGREVKVVLMKGPNTSDETVSLDALGHAQATFHSTQLGTNIATAEFVDNSAAMDAPP